MKQSKQYETGIVGEFSAEEYLCQKGMTVITRRYRGEDGEIDLVMLDQSTVVFVEVKTRPSGQQGAGLYAVTPSKQRRMIHAALAFLVEMEYTDRPVRFDVVEISRDGILHISNAFDASQSYR